MYDIKLQVNKKRKSVYDYRCLKGEKKPCISICEGKAIKSFYKEKSNIVTIKTVTFQLLL